MTAHKPIKFTQPRARLPWCFLCGKRLYAAGRTYVLMTIDDVEREVHAICRDEEARR